MGSLLRDFRYGLRMLAKSPGFTCIAVITLALGIGATTAIFSVIYGVLIRPLALPAARQIVEIVLTYHGETSEDGFTYDQFRYLQQHSRWPSAMAAFTHSGLNLTSGQETHRVSGLLVSSDYFRVLGVSPTLGRDFSLAEDKDPSARVAILSHSLWSRQFAGDRQVLGQTVLLNGTPYQVIGVMPPGQDNLQLDQVPPAFGDLQRVDLWTTLAPVAKSIGSGENLQVVARIQPALTLKQASAEFASLTDSFRQDQLQGEGRQQALGLTSVQSVMSESVRTYLWILLAAVAFLLLIACANISNLLLARGMVRAKEVAVRTAMGSSRSKLVRQFLIESLVLAGAGGLAGIVVAKLILVVLLRFAPQELPRIREIQIDGWALLFALAATLFSGIIAGVMPALRATKADVSTVLKENAAQGGGSLGKSRLRAGLVVSEIALSLVLLIGACLLGETFLNLMRVDPGFRANGLLSAEVWLTGSRVKTASDLNAFYQNLIPRLKQIPGVQGAGVVSSGQPLERGGNKGAVINGTEFGSINFRVVTPEYFRTLGTSMLQGREFEALDTERSEPVAIVNEAFVKQTLKDRDPFTSVVKLTDDSPRRIVGVAANVKSFVGFPPDPTIFIPADQSKIGLILGFDVWFPTHILVRTSGDARVLANSIQTAIRETDSSVPVGHVLSMEQILARSLATQRFMMMVVIVFASLALVLAAVGIYGLIAFSVSQRTHEIGIRMALGANTGTVLNMVLREGALLAVFGACLGVAATFAVQSLLASVLFGVRATDWRTMSLACLGLVLVALVACYIPARRATKVDPMVALRYE